MSKSLFFFFLCLSINLRAEIILREATPSDFFPCLQLCLNPENKNLLFANSCGVDASDIKIQNYLQSYFNNPFNTTLIAEQAGCVIGLLNYYTPKNANRSPKKNYDFQKNFVRNFIEATWFNLKCTLFKKLMKNAGGIIHLFLIHSEYRNQKLGSLMLSKALENIGIYPCSLITQPHLMGARHLYKNFGFKEISQAANTIFLHRPAPNR